MCIFNYRLLGATGVQSGGKEKNYEEFNHLYLLCLLGGILTLAVPNLTFAFPFSGPTWITDEPTQMALFFTSGPVSSDFDFNQAAAPGPNGHWLISNLVVEERDSVVASPITDTVNISGVLQHITGPHLPEGSGNQFSFSISFDAPTAAGGIQTQRGRVAHPGVNHFDEFEIQVQAVADFDETDIIGYGVCIGGGHIVPEPATVALLGIGLVGLAGAEVRRRLKKKAVDKS